MWSDQISILKLKGHFLKQLNYKWVQTADKKYFINFYNKPQKPQSSIQFSSKPTNFY